MDIINSRDKNDDFYMARCLQLAALGRGFVSPNPMVGAVVVCDGKIIGEGYHRQYGGPHAEVNAIRSVRDPELLSRSVLYVSLEPCSHYGKTPPCSELIIEKRIPEVVVGCVDPFASVSGRGIAMLRRAGVHVRVGILEQACRNLNRIFIISQLKQRPYIILKWAQSADAYIDSNRTEKEKPVQISTPVTQAWVHQLRSEIDAVWVGTETARKDNPSLTLRRWAGKNPIRLVSDRVLRLPRMLRLFTDGSPTWVLTSQTVENTSESPVSYVQVPFGPGSLQPTLSELFRRKIGSVLVEGGRELLTGFMTEQCWDEIRIEVSPVQLQEGVMAPVPKNAVLTGSQIYNGILFLRYERAEAHNE